jgi:hypothetical protein
MLAVLGSRIARRQDAKPGSAAVVPGGHAQGLRSPSTLSPIMVGKGPPPLMPPAAGSSDSAEAPSGIAHPVSMPSPPLNISAITVVMHR